MFGGDDDDNKSDKKKRESFDRSGKMGLRLASGKLEHEHQESTTHHNQ